MKCLTKQPIPFSIAYYFYDIHYFKFIFRFLLHSGMPIKD